MKSIMLMRLMRFILGVFIALFVCVSCTDEMNFETPSGCSLVFSKDTVSMDTVIAGMKSIDRTFTIYNRNSKGVSINKIEFLNGDADGFNVNVDGVTITGELPTSIDCAKNDSLFAFVQITPALSGSAEKKLHEATLVFTLANGKQQQVVLKAYSQDVEWLNHKVISSDTILDGTLPYVVKDSLVIASGAKLTLKAGVRMMFEPTAYMRVDGKLKVEGTLENPVILRGDRMDFMFTNQPYDRVSNQWQGIIIGADSYGDTLQYCDIHSGAYGIVCEKGDPTLEKIHIENSVIHNMSGSCFTSSNNKVFIGNSQITNAGGYCVALYGGDNQFIHCTIAQFYPFSAYRGTALYYANMLEDGKTLCDLVNASFQNCIITGYSSDEISGNKSDNLRAGAFNYYFQNCLLNTPEVVDDALVNILWDNKSNKVYREGNFPGFDLDKLLYDFHPDSLSMAVDAADFSVSQRYYPKDRLGVSRIAKERSSIGCYEPY